MQICNCLYSSARRDVQSVDERQRKMPGCKEPAQERNNGTSPRPSDVSEENEKSSPMTLTPKSASTRQQRLGECVKRQSLYAEVGAQEVAIAKHILYFTCKDKRPFDIVKGKGFQKLLKLLCPSYTIASVDTLKSRLDDIYTVKMNEVIGTFQEVSSFALMCDVWTETMCTKSFWA
ncbi:PREDICTED: uncharacterized protein LOC108367774 [Rhagoletis zephyria]|uniref:uncharacterized protein LOC108367774 n=1 Tax=Rhagoletis zephyria TaxID=28612 RepID=UPI000811294D|nr:PREDICTED: uncharacterized protein LOC108367774 [Rhagoletis zephyria]